MGIGVISNGTGLQDELIDTDQTDSVTARNVGNIFGSSTLHNKSSLEGLFMEIFLLTGLIVRSEDSNLLGGGNSTGEDSTESDESTLISGGNHLRDVHHEGTLGITSSQDDDIVILRTFVEISGSVLLSLSGGG